MLAFLRDALAPAKYFSMNTECSGEFDLPALTYMSNVAAIQTSPIICSSINVTNP